MKLKKLSNNSIILTKIIHRLLRLPLITKITLAIFILLVGVISGFVSSSLALRFKPKSPVIVSLIDQAKLSDFTVWDVTLPDKSGWYYVAVPTIMVDSNFHMRLDKLEKELDSLSIVPEESKIGLRLTNIENAMLDLDGRLKNIEKEITDDPVKVLATTKISEDIKKLNTNLEDQNKSHNDRLKKVEDKLDNQNERIDSVYQFRMTSVFGIVGIVTTIVLGLLNFPWIIKKIIKRFGFFKKLRA